jgi:CubicO group peptidase (beta-lactamase class C family)
MRCATVIAFALLLQFVALAAPQDEQNVDRIFAAFDKANSPGCALGVIRDGSFIYRKGYGQASLELGVPISAQSVFYMGSVSKQFTAASVVLAQEQGLLSLDDDVRKYIPEIPDYGQPITLRQMLHHTSGFRDFLSLLELSGRHFYDFHSKDEIIALIAHQKGLNNNPGDEYIYSNTNYYLLAEVVSHASKKSFAEFAAENIFKPLGMTHTRFYDDHTVVVPGRVAAYYPGDNGNFLVGWSTNYDAVGAGGLLSSVDDLLFWDRNFYANKLGKGTLLKELQTPAALNNGKQIGYGLGLMLGTYRGLPTVEHSGALFGYQTDILRFPEQRFTVVCLCNLSTSNPGGLAQKVADIYLEKNFHLEATNSRKSPDGVGVPDASAFAGKYLDPRTHSVYSFTVSGSDLVAWGASLRRIGPNQFKDLGTGTITFESTESNMKVSLEMDGSTIFAGSRIDQTRAAATDLTPFVGVYRSTEVDATYKLSVGKASLVLNVGWDPPFKFDPIARDEFENSEFGVLVFHRDANNHVLGLSVFTGPSRNVTFEKLN